MKNTHQIVEKYNMGRDYNTYELCFPLKSV